MDLRTKTVFLSNHYPTVNVNIPQNISIESNSIINYDLTQIVNEDSGNGMGIYKAVFNFGDGSDSKVFFPKLSYDNSLGRYTFKLPDIISHQHFKTSLSGDVNGTAEFYYKNGKTFTFILSNHYTLTNNIDFDFTITSNNSFVSLSADSLIGMVDNNNNLYNFIYSNSDNLIISNPFASQLVDDDGIFIVTDTDFDPILTDNNDKIFILFF